MPQAIRLPFVAALIAVLLGLTPGAGASGLVGQQPPGYDRWYAISIRGEPAGWMRTLQRVEGDGLVTSTTDLNLSLSRGALQVEIEMTSSFTETKTGEPVSMRSRQQLGAAPTETVFEFTDSKLIARTTTGGRTGEIELPLPEGTWLTPVQAERYVSQRMKAGAESVSVRTLEPLSGPAPITITRSNFTPERLTIKGETFEAVRCDVTSSSTPGLTTTEYLDRDGSIIKTSVVMGGLPIEMTLADPSVAQEEIRAPELMVSTFVRPSRAIDRPRETRRAVYILRGPGDALADLPMTAAQSVAVREPGTVEVRVDLDARVPAPEPDATDEAYRAATPFVDSRDEVIRGLARAATEKTGRDPAERAEAMRRFVYGYVASKHLGVGFATAGEVARTREGDCTEHATLLAAMLRADGIPARVVTGLIYADQFAGARRIFGFHMWTQALLPGEDGGHVWVDLDPTLPNSTPFDATHIALGTSALSTGEAQSSLSSIATLLGALSIEVIETDR